MVHDTHDNARNPRETEDGMSPDLVAALHRAMTEEDDPWKQEAIHASDLGATIPGEGCLRQVWLRVHGAERRPQTLGESLMFDHGHRIHERIGQLLTAGLKGSGWSVVGIEVPVEGLPEGLTGTLDLLLEQEGTGRREVWDFKTMRGRAFQYLDGPKPSHVLQVRSYMMGENIDADGGGIFYIDREGSNKAVPFPVERDDEAVREGAEILRSTAELIVPPPVLEASIERKQNKGPDSIYLKGPWPCDYCAYRDVSCPGALKPEHRDLGIVAKISDSGALDPKTNDAEVLDMIERYLWQTQEA